MAFKKAVKQAAKLRLALMGPSGAGKTFSALTIATGLGGKIAVIDTEQGSASKYADIFDFDVEELAPPYHPDRFSESIRSAAASGYSVIVIDSLTHAWRGTGGLLELVDEIAVKKAKGGTPNKFAAWGEGRPIQNRLIETIVSAPIHVIATMRSKQEYIQDRDSNGKSVIRKVGMAAEQNEGFEYEFDIVMDIDSDHNGIITKSRALPLSDKVFPKPGKQVAQLLNDWLQGTAPTATVVQPAPAQMQPKPEPITENTKKRMHAIGTKLYGKDGWDEQRGRLVAHITNQQFTSATKLTEAQAKTLIEGMDKKLNEAQAKLANVKQTGEVNLEEDDRLVADPA